MTKNRTVNLVSAGLGTGGHFIVEGLRSSHTHVPELINAQGAEFSWGLFLYGWINFMAEFIAPDFVDQNRSMVRVSAAILAGILDFMAETGILQNLTGLRSPYDPQWIREIGATMAGAFVGYLIDKMLAGDGYDR